MYYLSFIYALSRPTPSLHLNLYVVLLTNLKVVDFVEENGHRDVINVVSISQGAREKE